MTSDAPLTVLVDTREQRPWNFPSSPDVTVRSATLRTGDYTVAGLEGAVALERKSLGDAVQTVVYDWLRFRKELYRLASFDLAAVVVEATVGQIERHEYESEASPESVLGRLNSIWLDHGVPVLWWGDHETAARQALRLFRLAARRYGLVAGEQRQGEEG